LSKTIFFKLIITTIFNFFQIVTMFSRSTSVFRLSQYLRQKLSTVNTFYLAELQKNCRKSVYEYNQTRNFRNFGHTKKKYRFYHAIPIIICSTGMIVNFFDWQR